MGRASIFLPHISSTFSMEAEVSAAEPFTTDPGQDELSEQMFRVEIATWLP